MDGKLDKNPWGPRLSYIVMEYVPEGTMFDIVNNFSGVGEIVTHFFMK